MRSIIVAWALACSLTFGGCAQIQEALNAGKLITASYANPVTPTVINDLESGLTIAFAALKAYKQSCIKGAADVNCRSNIQAIQAYTRRIPPLLAELRTFVKSNDQVNAIAVYNEIKTLIASFKSAAASAGVPTGGL